MTRKPASDLVGARLYHLRMSIAEEVAAEEVLSSSLGQYAGRWVGVFNHRVVADAATLDDLLTVISAHPEETEVFQVAEDPYAICCF